MKHTFFFFIQKDIDSRTQWTARVLPLDIHQWHNLGTNICRSSHLKSSKPRGRTVTFSCCNPAVSFDAVKTWQENSVMNRISTSIIQQEYFGKVELPSWCYAQKNISPSINPFQVFAGLKQIKSKGPFDLKIIRLKVYKLPGPKMSYAQPGWKVYPFSELVPSWSFQVQVALGLRHAAAANQRSGPGSR